MAVIPVRANAAAQRPLWRRILRNRWVRRLAIPVTGIAIGWVCRELPPGICRDLCIAARGLLTGGG